MRLPDICMLSNICTSTHRDSTHFVLPAVNPSLMNRGATSLTSQTSIVTSPTLYSRLDTANHSSLTKYTLTFNITLQHIQASHVVIKLFKNYYYKVNVSYTYIY